MGGGSYSHHSHMYRISNLDYSSKSTNEIFNQRSINNAMDPHGVNVRESRDSEEHPESLAIILALDVTGSMGSVPSFLVKEGLPEIMKSIIEMGINDPQVLFMGIGDHECDNSPLQVSQFESSDELLDHWLKNIYLEGGGGGNDGESYHLAWYFAGQHTSIDCFEKRGKKGILFTIGDEPVLKNLPKNRLKQIMGPDGQYEDYDCYKLLEKASEKYHIFHIHVQETRAGQIKHTVNEWKQIVGSDNLFLANKREDVAQIIVDCIKSCVGSKVKMTQSVKERIEENSKTEEMML